jgi:hypothetical protein
MLRKIIGFVAGGLAWMPLFFALAIGLGLVWPGYAEHGRVWFEENVFTFTSAMAAMNVVFWALADVGAGWVAMTIAKHRAVLWMLAGTVTFYLGLLHFGLYWALFPWWYNVGVVIPALPAVLLGGYVARAARLTDLRK